ncbi:MAG: D-alanine-D-alanine ligase [Candidatus Improbicoccus pseudotrichonymphae]|uniref:D-alanine-D-alanine ligase n=1 Tax=Candidatus Improbicoccus pseudotrichonymphae TaxID=3033792 RepID=A0AA48I8N4_9FIRM|nr:MAG: D-alanine-D-alanine ligase [Candidatus Improbicoccus pseudotrichonymphae]
MKLAVICGGPSPEHSISLNSARSVYDALFSPDNFRNNIEIKIIFINKNYEKYLIDEEFIYSNTVFDFNFKLEDKDRLNNKEFLSFLKSCDLVFPIMHGIYCEDGEIQKTFEKEKISFVGSSSKSCYDLYNKKKSDLILKENNYFTIKKLFLNLDENSDSLEDLISDFLKENNLKKIIIKPVQGGSSLGVSCADSFEKILNVVRSMHKSGEKNLVIEEMCQGKEFTIIIIESHVNNEPIALIPIEIEIKDSENLIFDTRRKYLATNETHYHFPPRFSYDLTNKIREQSQKLFKLFKARDFLRIDGWVLNNDKLYFSDFNPISGMEQNSFIFQQASKIGISHKNMISYIIKNSAIRNNVVFEEDNVDNNREKKKVNVLFGGTTSERQVSLLSGSNVWLKLLKSNKFSPKPFLLYSENSEFYVLELSYDMVLYHTVEEIMYQHKNNKTENKFLELINKIRESLGLSGKYDKKKSEILKISDFLEKSKRENAYIFSALHGGFGENGEIQNLFEKYGLKFNGSGSVASKICMNKFETGQIVNSFGLKKFRSAKKIIFNIFEKTPSWREINDYIGQQAIIKPNDDGCSTGVVLISNEKELEFYINSIKNKDKFIKNNSFKFQNRNIMLSCACENYLVEEFIKTNEIRIENKSVILKDSDDFVELTIGVIEKDGFYHAFNPSITIAESGALLSVEEKFQGGQGVNITPPPDFIISKDLLKTIKSNVEKLCEKVKIKDYCRIDLFANNKTNEIVIIEINTLPALTPSTVLFQQAAKEPSPINPLNLLENIIKI